WHEHDADEIQHHADICIEDGTKALEAAGWAKESVKILGVTHEPARAWSRKTGKPLCKAIVWDDSRTKHTVAHFERKLRDVGIQVSPGELLFMGMEVKSTLDLDNTGETLVGIGQRWWRIVLTYGVI
ncbi:hypothetical protein JOM56_007502, partial [Amanita muscaria]